MSTLAWRLKRLRTMTATEVGYRVYCSIKDWVCCIAVLVKKPTPSKSVVPGTPIFGQQLDWITTWRKHFSIDEPGIGRFLSGVGDVLGYGELRFGNPIDWHRDPLTGIRSPAKFGRFLNYRNRELVGNVKVVWEIGRHQFLVPMAAAFAVTGDRRYREAIGAYVDSWLNENPYPRGIHWCSSLEVSLRLISWAVVHSFLSLRDPEGLFGCVASRETLGNSLYLHAHFIRAHLSRFSSANNHLIGELCGLFMGASVFDFGNDGARWKTEARYELETQAKLQVFSDGVSKEQSINYHLHVLEYFLLAFLVGMRDGMPFSEALRDIIVSMVKFVNDIAPEGGEPPAIGDSDGGSVVSFALDGKKSRPADLAASAALCLDRLDLYPTSRDLSQKAFWYLLIRGRPHAFDTRPANVKRSRRHPKCYPLGGYAILRDDQIHMVFDAGSLGYLSIAGHGHADALSFSLALGDRWWIVDPGTYSYDEPLWRDFFRGTSAHNTVRIDTKDQSEMGGPFIWLSHAASEVTKFTVGDDGSQTVVARHDGYQRLGVAHQREINLEPGNRITILDSFSGAGEHIVEIFFHFAPEVNVDYDADLDKWVASYSGLRSQQLSLAVDARAVWSAWYGSIQPQLGWYSDSYGTKSKVYTLRGTSRRALPLSLRTTLEYSKH